MLLEHHLMLGCLQVPYLEDEGMHVRLGNVPAIC